MNIEFEDKALEELYYVKVVNYMKAACRIENLYLINSLHYEKK